MKSFFSRKWHMRKKHIYSGTAQEDSKPAIGSRRALLGSMATLGAGLAGSMIAPQKLHAVSETARHTAPENLAAPCGRSKVVASDAATVVETSAGKIRGYKRNGIYIFKVSPTARQPPERDALCRQRNLNPGREFETRWNMAASVLSRTQHTSIWMAKTWLATTNISS